MLSNLLDLITSGPILVLELVGDNAVGAWRDTIGPTDPSEARHSAPTSIRAQFGKGTINTFNSAEGYKPFILFCKSTCFGIYLDYLVCCFNHAILFKGPVIMSIISVTVLYSSSVHSIFWIPCNRLLIYACFTLQIVNHVCQVNIYYASS